MLQPAALALTLLPRTGPQTFVNWESAHVHPLELTPDRARLLAVNTADGRLEVLDVTTGTPVPAAAIPVGLDPVSVRARTSLEAWVVNRISDSVSVVNLATRNVVATLRAEDEPADVVFAGTPRRAFVSCSGTRAVLVFDPADLAAPPLRVALAGEQPRALAASADGTRVYVAFFESGNQTTLLGSGGIQPGDFPPDVVGYPGGPYGGQNPPPNAGALFEPPLAGGLPAPPEVGLIVRRDAGGAWKDDNGGDWTSFVSGPQAALSGRRPGWTLLDHDVAILDASTLALSYADHLMNICMALAVQPGSGRVSVVGTEALNQIRYLPNLRGRFLRVELALVAPPAAPALVDLNPHLDYASGTVAQSERDRSLADPRGIAWNAAGTRAYVTGMGSNAVAVLDGSGARAGLIAVGQGPTGVALDELRARLYVLDKFEAALSVVDTTSERELARVPFHDPTPAAIRNGREYLYDARARSGLGHVACASCHVDARTDRLAWDLGDPSGAVQPLAGENLGAGVPGRTSGFVDFHPMKGPLLTQTLQDVIGKEPFHWRGDFAGIEAFNASFETLLGDDEVLDAGQMQELEDFLATIQYPPNPNRALDGSLRTDLPLPGHVSSGRYSPAGTPLPDGDAVHGRELFRLSSNQCRTCHTLPTGQGTNHTWDGTAFVPLPEGPLGEDHHALHPPGFQLMLDVKIAQLRNLYQRTGCDFALPECTAGFGFRHDGGIDSLAHFLTRVPFDLGGDQDVADLIAFLVSISGELEVESATDQLDFPPGEAGRHTHPAVGRQMTLAGAPSAAQSAELAVLTALAADGALGLVVKGRVGGAPRGAFLDGARFQSDRRRERFTLAALTALAGPGSELTFTAVPYGSEERIGADRDGDHAYDQDELDAGTDPLDPSSFPKHQYVPGRRRP